MLFIESNDPTAHLCFNILYNTINCCLYVEHAEFSVILNIHSTQVLLYKTQWFLVLSNNMFLGLVCILKKGIFKKGTTFDNYQSNLYISEVQIESDDTTRL
jgi:hypothetical protein